MKKILTIGFVFLLMMLDTGNSFAASSYVLPYPSTMPGGITYKLHLLWEKVLQYWYFGDLGKVEYSMKESDKYLVEAKTLFDYQQYLLGYQALVKSDVYFEQILPNLTSAKVHGKDISEDRATLTLEAQKHVEVLGQMQKEVPANVLWSPEKAASTSLNLASEIKNAIKIRKEDL